MKHNWKQLLANMGIKPAAKTGATNLLEVTGATGELISFPDISDPTEIAEGTAVVADDGDHVFDVDMKCYTVTVAGGLVTAVLIEDCAPADPAAPAAPADPAAPSTDTTAFLTAVVEEITALNAANVTKDAQIATMLETINGLNTTLTTLKGLMSHGGDGAEGNKPESTNVVIGGKNIDLSKINLKK